MVSQIYLRLCLQFSAMYLRFFRPTVFSLELNEADVLDFYLIAEVQGSSKVFKYLAREDNLVITIMGGSIEQMCVQHNLGMKSISSSQNKGGATSSLGPCS